MGESVHERSAAPRIAHEALDVAKQGGAPRLRIPDHQDVETEVEGPQNGRGLLGAIDEQAAIGVRPGQRSLANLQHLHI
jgi:hypothetical protein